MLPILTRIGIVFFMESHKKTRNYFNLSIVSVDFTLCRVVHSDLFSLRGGLVNLMVFVCWTFLYFIILFFLYFKRFTNNLFVLKVFLHNLLFIKKKSKDQVAPHITFR